MNPSWLRLVYIFEFLLALIAVFTCWSEIGAQGHLDLMPWYWKAILGVGMSWTIVRATGAAITHEKAWNAKCIGWLLLTLLLAAAMGLATLYAHLNEDDGGDRDDMDNTTLTSVWHRPALTDVRFFPTCDALAHYGYRQ